MWSVRCLEVGLMTCYSGPCVLASTKASAKGAANKRSREASARNPGSTALLYRIRRLIPHRTFVIDASEMARISYRSRRACRPSTLSQTDTHPPTYSSLHTIRAGEFTPKFTARAVSPHPPIRCTKVAAPTSQPSIAHCGERTSSSPTIREHSY